MDAPPIGPGPAARAGGGPWHARLAGAPASVALVVLDVAVLAWVAVALGDPSSREVQLAAGALERGRVWGGEWWRLATAAVLHAGWLHLGANAVFGFGWCRLVERALGTGRFLLVYAASALAGSAASLLAWDAVSVGASGALFGVMGAALALHRRALPGWRAFLRSPATVQVALQLGAWTAFAVVASLHLDHAAHAGGLVAGAAVAWRLTAPPPRLAGALALAAALAALAVAACWPRATLSDASADALVARIHRAVRDQDRAAAAALLDEAVRGGVAGEAVEYYRAFLDVQEGRLEPAAARLRPIAFGAASPAREEARRAYAGVARNLAYRSCTGEGAPQDGDRCLAWLDEACAAGDEASCRDATRLRGAPAP